MPEDTHRKPPLGILDRFDSLLFVMPVAFLLLGRLLLPVPR